MYIQRVLTMVYNTQNYWVFGLCPTSDFQETRKHNVSDWICFRAQVRGVITYSVRSLRKNY
jgi:hypothetical protein